KSIALFRTVLEDLERFIQTRGCERLQDITAADLEDYRLHLVNRDFAPASLCRYLRTVRQFFAWLEEHQHLFLNPAADLTLPAVPPKLLAVPSEEEMTRLLAQPNINTLCGLRDRALLETLYATGARREEMNRMNTAHLDLDNRTVRVMGKGRRERMLPLGTQASDWLGRYLKTARPKLLRGNDEEPALWIDRHGHRLAYAMFPQIVRQHARQASLSTHLTPHSIRRACATHMLRHGAHPLQLQLLLGHSSLRHLSQYLRLSITDLQRAHAQTNPGR
ncbi:MAG: tyrosine-type recombinase/integrase, partial [Phycisphaerae bacterium]